MSSLLEYRNHKGKEHGFVVYRCTPGAVLWCVLKKYVINHEKKEIKLTRKQNWKIPKNSNFSGACTDFSQFQESLSFLMIILLNKVSAKSRFVFIGQMFLDKHYLQKLKYLRLTSFMPPKNVYTKEFLYSANKMETGKTMSSHHLSANHSKMSCLLLHLLWLLLFLYFVFFFLFINNKVFSN